MVSKTDGELIHEALGGDDKSFAELVERHLSAVYKFTYQYVHNADDTNDVVQEAFIRAWKHLAKFDTSKNFKTWIITIAKNAALDLLKKKRHVLFSRIEEGENDLDSFLAPYSESPETPDQVFDEKVTKEALESALEKISPSYRVVLMLRYAEHMKFREIADILQEPVDTVKSKHRRGLIQLRGVFAGESVGRT